MSNRRVSARFNRSAAAGPRGASEFQDIEAAGRYFSAGVDIAGAHNFTTDLERGAHGLKRTRRDA